MNTSISRSSRHGVVRVITAAILTVAGAKLVQAQQTTPPQNGTTTHSAKKAELKRLEQNGYKPGATDPHYPQNIQNAEKKANAGNGSSTPMTNGQNSQ